MSIDYTAPPFDSADFIEVGPTLGVGTSSVVANGAKTGSWIRIYKAPLNDWSGFRCRATFSNVVLASQSGASGGGESYNTHVGLGIVKLGDYDYPATWTENSPLGIYFAGTNSDGSYQHVWWGDGFSSVGVVSGSYGSKTGATYSGYVDFQVGQKTGTGTGYSTYSFVILRMYIGGTLYTKTIPNVKIYDDRAIVLNGRDNPADSTYTWHVSDTFQLDALEISHVSTTAFTVGTGGDFEEWKSAWDFLYSVSPLADNYTFTQISNTSESARLSTAGQINLNSKTVTFATSVSHSGKYNSAYKINLGSGIEFDPNTTGAGTLDINGLCFVSAANNVAASALLRKSSSASNSIIKTRNCLFNGASHLRTCILLNISSGTYKVSNCKMWDATNGINNGSMSNDVIVENSAIYNCGTGCLVSFTPTKMNFKNVVVAFPVGAIGKTCFSGAATSVFSNCADTDGTTPSHTGRQASIVVTDEFKSLDYTNDEFLVPIIN